MVKDFIARLKNDEDNKLKRKAYKALGSFIVVLGLFIAFGILFPTATAIVLNTIWVILFAVVVTFLTLGVLVIFGLRKEVGDILDIILEGGLTLLDAIEFLKKAWAKFKLMVKEFLVYASPIFAYIAAMLVYILVLVLYKRVGRTYDVTFITIALTFLLMVFIGVLTRPTKRPSEVSRAWLREFFKRFHRGFTDGLEVVLFVFFLTMDSTKLFFLPKSLNHELHASWGEYDLMVRGVSFTDHTQVTITLIIITISIEILRNIIRLFAMSRKYFRELKEQEQHNRLKNSIRMAFGESKDDLTRFITFTTVLLIVFLIFPRLKLLTLVVASITSLLLDFLIRGRLVIQKGDDLFNRLLAKAFKL